MATYISSRLANLYLFKATAMFSSVITSSISKLFALISSFNKISPLTKFSSRAAFLKNALIFDLVCDDVAISSQDRFGPVEFLLVRISQISPVEST